MRKKIGLVVLKEENKKKRVRKLSKIFLSKNFRCKGIGKEVLKMIEGKLQNQGYKYLLLNVFYPNQVAYQFYKNKGFKEDRLI